MTSEQAHHPSWIMEELQSLADRAATSADLVARNKTPLPLDLLLRVEQRAWNARFRKRRKKA